MTIYATGTSDAGTPVFYEGDHAPSGFTPVDQGAYMAALAAARDAAAKASAEIIVPISRAQALIQLRRTPGSKPGKTLRDDVEAAVTVADGEVQDWYNLAGSWLRFNPYVEQLSAQLGLAPSQVDDLFREAAKIQA